MVKRDSKGQFARKDGESCGTYVDDKGYLRISAGPLRGVRLHTLILEAKLGRKLEKWEDTHHRDGNKLNILPDNLEAIDHRKHGWVSSRQAQFMKRKEEEDRKEWEAQWGSLESFPSDMPLMVFPMYSPWRVVVSREQAC